MRAVGQFAVGIVHTVKKRFCSIVISSPLVRKRHAARISIEQHNAEALLERANSFTDRRLGITCSTGRSGETASFNHGDEGA